MPVAGTGRKHGQLEASTCRGNATNGPNNPSEWVEFCEEQR